MATFTEINLMLSRNRDLWSRAWYERSTTPLYFQAYRQPWNTPILEGPVQTPSNRNVLDVHPEMLCAEDYSKATVGALKVFLAWHSFETVPFGLDPSDIVIFISGSAIPLSDDVPITSITDSMYGEHGRDFPLAVVFKAKRRPWLEKLKRKLGLVRRRKGVKYRPPCFRRVIRINE